MEFVTWTNNESFVLMSMGGGVELFQVSVGFLLELLDLRPSVIDSDYPTLLKVVWAGVVDPSDVPPYFMHTCKRRRDQESQKNRNGRLHPARHGGGGDKFQGGKLATPIYDALV